MLIPKIVITGGPCSGKTTGMSYLSEKLSDFGFRVFVVPETATMIINSGLDIRLMKSVEQVLDFQSAILDLQIFLEKEIEDHANKIFPNDKKVILLDRGLMDIYSYIPVGYENVFIKMLEKHRLSFVQARDNYNGIIHLVTSAIGAEKFYTNENNPARYENSKEACISCDRTCNAWVGHPHFRVIDNSTNFEGKMKRALSAACSFLGIPCPIEIERKYLVDSVNMNQVLFMSKKIEIEQLYLVSNKTDNEIRIRKRGQEKSWMYFMTKKKNSDNPMIRMETEDTIQEGEYELLSRFIEPNTSKIVKDRYCFVWGNQYFELDFFKEPKGLILLEIELTDQNDVVNIPPFIKVKEEVTGKKEFTNREISRNLVY